MEAFAVRYDAPARREHSTLDTALHWVAAGLTWVGQTLHLNSAKEHTVKITHQVRETAASVGESVGSGVKAGVDAARKQISSDKKSSAPKKSGEKCEYCKGVGLAVLVGVVAAVSVTGYMVYVKRIKSKKDKKQA
ncbi:uncharacterized protein TM35_000024300 [Trypanosoma theileri]|uniref:Uncharacterized protein n=1 Tax=Trypanosoma theileri TaxID=67003 RepID=A0A1X0P855_9TRYP|nr:uncharacterized protein TM35_000024300 [Trypanosoma theileri]ORC93104.1 hypothetical protein TM35_000024300 [Trypanosoma theileri]